MKFRDVWDGKTCAVNGVYSNFARIRKFDFAETDVDELTLIGRRRFDVQIDSCVIVHACKGYKNEQFKNGRDWALKKVEAELQKSLGWAELKKLRTF